MLIRFVTAYNAFVSTVINMRRYLRILSACDAYMSGIERMYGLRPLCPQCNVSADDRKFGNAFCKILVRKPPLKRAAGISRRIQYRRERIHIVPNGIRSGVLSAAEFISHFVLYRGIRRRKYGVARQRIRKAHFFTVRIPAVEHIMFAFCRRRSQLGKRFRTAVRQSFSSAHE